MSTTLVEKDGIGPKPIDQLSEQTTVSEFEDIVFSFLGTYGVTNREDPVFSLVRDGILFSSVFAPSPAIFDQHAMVNIYELSGLEIKNISRLCDVLEAFGVIKKVEMSEVPVSYAKEIVDTQLTREYPDGGFVPEGLYEQLISTQQTLMSNEYAILPRNKYIVETIFSRYPEEE